MELEDEKAMKDYGSADSGASRDILGAALEAKSSNSTDVKKEKNVTKEKTKKIRQKKIRSCIGKSDLIIKFSEKNNITVKDAERVLEIVINEITSALSKGNRVEFRGFEFLTLQSEWLEQPETLKRVKP